MENTRIAMLSQEHFPETGKFHIDVWAKMLDCTAETVRKILIEFKIRFIKFGATIVIVAEWWWAALTGVIDEPTVPEKDSALRQPVAQKRGKSQR